MPTLLRSNAAAGVAMGLDSHSKELDRTEMQRQFDMSRRDKARAMQGSLIAAMLDPKSNTNNEVSDGKGGRMKIGDLVQDVTANHLNETTPGRWFEQYGGAVFPVDSSAIYDNYKVFPVTPGSRSEEIIKGKK